MINAILAREFIKSIVANRRLGLPNSFRMIKCFFVPLSESSSKSVSRCEKKAFSELEQIADIIKQMSIHTRTEVVTPNGISSQGLMNADSVVKDSMVFKNEGIYTFASLGGGDWGTLRWKYRSIN